MLGHVADTIIISQKLEFKVRQELEFERWSGFAQW
jgi:hypothetical protein